MLLQEAKLVSVKLSKEKEAEIKKHMFGEQEDLNNQQLTSNLDNNHLNNK